MAQIVFASLLTSRLKPKVDWVVIYVVSSVCCSWLTEVCGAHDESSRRNRAQRDSSTRRNVRHTLLGLHAVAFFLETITHISNPVPFLLCFAFIILQEKIGLPLLVWKCLHRTGPYEDRDNLAEATVYWIFALGEITLAGCVTWKHFEEGNALALVCFFSNIFFPLYTYVRHGLDSYMQCNSFDAAFPAASTLELLKHCDVCPICLLPMAAARRTGCHHYFHKACLKRSLQVRVECPMCNTPMITADQPIQHETDIDVPLPHRM